MRFAEKINIDWLGKRKTFYVISGVVFFVCLLSLIFKGLEFGIDFKGGTEIGLQFQDKIEIADLRNEINKLNVGKIEIKSFGNENGFLIRTDAQNLTEENVKQAISTIESTITKNFPNLEKKVTDSNLRSITLELADSQYVAKTISLMAELGFESNPASLEANNKVINIPIGIADWIEHNLIVKYPSNTFQVLKEEQVGPKMGQELKNDAVIAIVLALIGMLIYIGFRFKFVFAFSAIITLIHDVIITLGMFSILYEIAPVLNLEINVTIVAAFLALVGYSINDTVIVFDRIREVIKINKTADLQDSINKGINRTISRTIITSGTTLLTVMTLLIIGGDVLRGFAFALTFGVLIGTYSSIFVSSAFVYDYATRKSKRIEF